MQKRYGTDARERVVALQRLVDSAPGLGEG